MPTSITKKYPDRATVRRLFDLRDGNLYWAVRPSNSIRVGQIAGHIKQGHGRAIIIEGKAFVARHLIEIYQGAQP